MLTIITNIKSALAQKCQEFVVNFKSTSGEIKFGGKKEINQVQPKSN